DGTITISAQNFDPAKGFQYSLNNGATWTTQMTSPYIITGLAANNYDVQVRYENVVDTCMIPLTQNITPPTPLLLTLSVTPITCLDGSTVMAAASGSSAAYTSQLLDATSLTLISNFPSSGVLTNVAAGDYLVRVTDANECIEEHSLTVTAP